MRILYLCYDGLTDALGRSQVLPYILGLEAMGHSFDIISLEKPSALATGGASVRSLLEGKGIQWHPLRWESSLPVVSPLLNVRRMSALAMSLSAKNAYALTHCRGYLSAMVGHAMQKDLGVPFLFDMRGFYADERVDGKLWELRNPVFRLVYQFFKKKERSFLQDADAVVSLTQRGKGIIESWDWRTGGLPIAVIPCCADLSHFDSEAVNPNSMRAAARELGLREDDFVISYLGSVGTWYMLPEMLAFFKRLMLRRPGAVFLFITPDPPHGILAEARRQGVPEGSLRFRAASREDVPTYLSLSTVSIFFIIPTFSKAASSPTKHGELLGMGIPVIANAGVGDVDSIISDTGTGLLVPGFTDADYDRALEGLDAIIALPKAKMREAADQIYSLAIGVARYDAIYHSIGKGT